MERLKQKILSEGKALSEHVLLVDSFLIIRSTPS